MEAGCLSVSLVDYEFNHSSKQMTLVKTTCYTQQLYEYACEVFEKLWDNHTPIRQLGVHTTKLTDSHIHQVSLFEQTESSFEKQKKLAKLDVVIDAIRSKYGEDAIKRATFLNGNLDHMAGGISKEKKDGITKEV